MKRLLKVVPVLFILLTNACTVGMQAGISAPSGGSFFGTRPILVTNSLTAVQTNIAFVDILNQCNRIEGRLKVGESMAIRSTNFSCAQGDQVTLLAKGYSVLGTDTVYVGVVKQSFNVNANSPKTWEITNIPIRR